ncbi:MAG TPA: hypothetical protein VLC10_01445 [Patescibacteria group bacterium]|nr:hypothetical protein [Patescibacteria group bacterium]
MTRTTRRETNRLRAEIMEGLAEYCEERDDAARISRCGMIATGIPAGWLRLLAQASAADMPLRPDLRIGLFGRHRPQPLYLN